MTGPKQSGERLPRAGGTGKKKVAAGGVGAIVLAIIVLAIQHFTGVDLTDQETGTAPDAGPSPTSSTRSPQPEARNVTASPAVPVSGPAVPGDVAERGVQAMHDAFANGQSDLVVEAAGRVIKVLPDDHDGDRHQRFILKTSRGQTVLIAHNIDLAPRVPVREGDTVRFKGEYEWSEQGGVIHWTHHDPQGWREGGWIEHAGKTYE